MKQASWCREEIAMKDDPTRKRVRAAVDSAIESRRRRVEDGTWAKEKARDSAAEERYSEKVSARQQETLRDFGHTRYKG
jgi:predicted alpha/beta hydrolase